MKSNNSSRRNFLKLSALTGAFLGLSPEHALSREAQIDQLAKLSQAPSAKGASVMGLRTEPIEQVRMGFIGLGNRGPGHVHRAQYLYPRAKVVALCDIRKNRAEKVAGWLDERGHKADVYGGTEDAWKEMVRRDDLDLILISTPWKDHAEMCIYAMKQGKHVACEVPLAITLQECWDLVNTAEETQRNCIMLENVCYGDEELWVLNMVNKGVFGTLTYAEAAYIHNLRDSLFSKTGYYDMWRIRHHVEKDGNLYPTHGLGPIAQYMDINRGDRFDFLVSMSSLEASLSEHSLSVENDSEFYNRQDFEHGDMNNTLVKTALGRTILIQHDVVTPRPYSRINLLAGTKATHTGYPSRLSLHGKGHEWLPEDMYKEMYGTYRHPIWDKLKEEIAQNGGHGGMDFVMMYRLIECLNEGKPLDMDVYDGADWSVITPLSNLSVQLGSIPTRFPDFTREKWKGKRLLGMMEHV